MLGLLEHQKHSSPLSLARGLLCAVLLSKPIYGLYPPTLLTLLSSLISILSSPFSSHFITSSHVTRVIRIEKSQPRSTWDLNHALIFSLFPDRDGYAAMSNLILPREAIGGGSWRREGNRAVPPLPEAFSTDFSLLKLTPKPYFSYARNKMS